MMARSKLALVMLFVATSTVLSMPANTFAGELYTRISAVSPANYENTQFFVTVQIFISKDITRGKVSATFKSGGKTYTAGPRAVSSGKVVKGGTKKGWRLVTLTKTTKSRKVTDLKGRYHKPK